MMGDKHNNFREYIKEKLDDKTFRLMCYSCLSFNKQKEALHELFKDLRQQNPKAYEELDITKYIICGWAGDLTRLFGICLPDFMCKFGKGISVGDIIMITEEELLRRLNEKA